jgi:hypothetical protein
VIKNFYSSVVLYLFLFFNFVHFTVVALRHFFFRSISWTLDLDILSFLAVVLVQVPFALLLERIVSQDVRRILGEKLYLSISERLKKDKFWIKHSAKVVLACKVVLIIGALVSIYLGVTTCYVRYFEFL